MVFLSAAALAVVLSMYCQRFVPEAGQFPLYSIHMLCHLHQHKGIMRQTSRQPNDTACLANCLIALSCLVLGQQLLVLIL